MSCGFFPALDKAGWREAPGWFEAVIPPVSYTHLTLPTSDLV